MAFPWSGRAVFSAWLAWLSLGSAVRAAAETGTPSRESALRATAAELEQTLARLRPSAASPTPTDRWADADVFRKGVAWALRYDTAFEPRDLALLEKAVTRGNERAHALAAGRHPGAAQKGRGVRGFISAIDGSTQPYGVIVPSRYDPTQPIRLDVVLHGSTRPVGLSELRFMERFDQGDEPPASSATPSDAAPSRPGDPPPDADYIELHPLGRVENGYRWAGETDVFEAIEAACRNYNIDRDRIVLRGMSMGASGTWHLGLKHPDVFVALGPYCGYVDTHRFSETPLPNFVRVGPLAPHQEKMLHILDSVDYAANAGVVPAIACIGEKDVFFDAHVIMGRAMEREGIEMVNLISPGTGHVIDPVTHGEQMRRIAGYAAAGLDHVPRHLRFVTWTLKYSRCHWVQLLGLDEHYARAEFEARVSEDGSVAVNEPKNITRFAILPPLLQRAGTRLRVDGAELALDRAPNDQRPRRWIIARRDGAWTCLGADEPPHARKRPGLQGPIDDAFTKPFLCVRGTGKAWNPAVAAWSEANLKRFEYEWHRYFRGELPVKDDTAVTSEDLGRASLILFGDPGSNLWIRRALHGLPFEWTPEALRIGGERYPAANHAPLVVAASPLDGADGHYLVLNSGHTFHEKELASLNYLLFPRLADWAVMRVGAVARDAASPSDAVKESVVKTGFLDESGAVCN